MRDETKTRAPLSVEADSLEYEIFCRTALNAFPAHTAILDEDGTILYTNSAWQAFADANGLRHFNFIGLNYLSVCDNATGPWSEEAPFVAAGLRSLIARQTGLFTLEYPCHSPTEKRWFTMRATRLNNSTPLRLLITHENITDRRIAEEALRAAHSEMESRVRARTAELAKTNKELQSEIAERKKAERKIIQQNEFLNHVLESLPHPFYVLDANDYTIKMANSAAASESVFTGTTCYALTHKRTTPCDGLEHKCPLHLVKQTRKPVTVEHVHFDREGQPRNVEVHGYPIFDKDGNVVQMIEYALDITERKRMEEALRLNAEKIKLFAYTVSHDLKSPLIGINGLIRLLHKQYGNMLDDKAKKYCDQILKASEQVVALIEEINVYIRTKEVPLKFETVDPKEVIQMVRDEFGALLSTRQIDWSEPDHIPKITADKLSMLRVFRNLIDNALKYGGEDLSAIRIGYEESDEFHTFSVSDNGVGIKKERCKEIFGLFKREETSRGIEGSGLGLAIVHEIAEKHHGNVWAEPTPARGVTFFVSFSKTL